MKHLSEIYGDIDRQCNDSKPPILLHKEADMLFEASKEYVESLLKIGERWESVLKYDLHSLKIDMEWRKNQKGFRIGAEMLICLINEELKRYGVSMPEEFLPDIVPSFIHAGNVPHQARFPEWEQLDKELKKAFDTPHNYKEFSKGCYLPNGVLKSQKEIVSIYAQKRGQDKSNLKKPIPTLFYKGIIKKLFHKPVCIRTIQRYFEEFAK